MTFPLFGRASEQGQIAALLAGAREDHSGVLVLAGEAGIGKTTLIDAALAHNPDLWVIRIQGAETEMELVYAGLQQVCAPLLGSLERLPTPQRKALKVTLGLTEGHGAPDPLLVGLALLTLFAEAGSRQPIVCIVDDAHWVDRASLGALAFVARRLLADRVVMVFATRVSVDMLTGLPALTLRGLDESDARALLGAVVPGRISDRVRESIIAESGGNPLAILELHHALSPGEMAGGYGLPQAKSITGRIEDTFLRQIQTLPPPTRTLLLIAAAEPTGEPSWFWAAGGCLGIGVESAAPAEEAGLISLDGRIRFRHPLVRSAIYGNATLADRRRAHGALAQVISNPRATDHRAWHRAHAVDAADEEVAAELELAAEQARARGGTAAAAAFLELAAEATPDPGKRALRALNAAQAKLDAGALDAAARLLDHATELTDDDSVGAHVDLLRARIAFAARRGRDGPPLLLAAARRLAPIDAALARETYLEALLYSFIVGRFAVDEQFRPAKIAQEARRAPPPEGPPTVVDLLLDGLIARYTEGYATAVPLLKRALAGFSLDDYDIVSGIRWYTFANQVCLDLIDQDGFNLLTVREVEHLRAAGAITMLPTALSAYAGMRIVDGDIAAAAAALEEAEAITAATGAAAQASLEPYMAAYCGEESLCLESARTAIADATARGEGVEVTLVYYALAILHNSLGNYSQAVEACLTGMEDDDYGLAGYLLPELVEAASRSGQQAIAEDALGRLLERAYASRTPTAFGMAAVSKALLNDEDNANDDYLEGIAHLEDSPLVVLRARARLVYGEWLRRVNRRAEARTQLRIARDMFLEMGVHGFAARARRELGAAGVTVTEHAEGVPVMLTRQERHIARLVCDGHTNFEIGAQLFISPRTVEWHLGRIFAKVGVKTRRELQRMIARSSIELT